MEKETTNSDLSLDDSVSLPTEFEKSTQLKRNLFKVFTILSLGGIAGVFVLAAWSDSASRFQELEERLGPYKTYLVYFIPIGLAFLLVSLIAAKYSNANLIPIAVLAMLLVGATLGGATFSTGNDHRFATKSNGPVSLEAIAEASPAKQARETWLTYIRLDEFLDGKPVITARSLGNNLVLNAFSGAKVITDDGYDYATVPFSRMTGMEILFEGPIDKERRLLLFGEGDSYTVYSSPTTLYVVAD